MTRKIAFFEGWSWFKFNNLGLALGTNLKFYTSVAKGLKLKVRKFLGLNPTFVGITEQKLNSPKKSKTSFKNINNFSLCLGKEITTKNFTKVVRKTFICVCTSKNPPTPSFLPLSLLVHKHRYCITPTSPKLVCKY